MFPLCASLISVSLHIRDQILKELHTKFPALLTITSVQQNFHTEKCFNLTCIRHFVYPSAYNPSAHHSVTTNVTPF